MSFGRSCRFPFLRLLGNLRVWLCALIALATLVSIPAFGQDGPPVGYKASGAATTASSAAVAKVAPAPGAQGTKAQTSSKLLTRAKAGDPAKADPPKADPPPLTGLAAQCAHLLNMAKTLKTEVDKTTQDVLSVAVVRDAGEIQQMAHKLRDDQNSH